MRGWVAMWLEVGGWVAMWLQVGLGMGLAMWLAAGNGGEEDAWKQGGGRSRDTHRSTGMERQQERWQAHIGKKSNRPK